MEPHKKSYPSDLALDKLCVTQFCWLRLCTTVAMGMKIANCWKLFRSGVKRYHYDKFIGIRELSKRIASDFFNNPFTTDTGTLGNNIPSLDEIDNEGTVFTYRRLNYYSSYPCNSETSTILYITISTALTTAIGHMAPKEFNWGEVGS